MDDKLLEELEILNNSEKIIIVEGKKDKKALEKLDITNVVTLKMPIFQQCEEIAKEHKEVIILTDLDKEGKRLYSMIKKNLERNGVKIDDRFRNFLFKETKLTQIEGLLTYIKNNKAKSTSPC